MRKNERGITLIALVVTIVVLLILAGVSISMLTGENGIITQAQKSKLQTEIGKEKEYITLSVSAVKGDKISRGDTSEITSSELQNEINNYTDEATVTGNGTLIVTYESGRSYEVEQDGSITQKEELTPEEAKKIVYTTGCGYNIPGLLVETADGTVYYVDNLQEEVMQKIEIVDAEIITTNGIKEAGENYFIDNEGKVYTWGDNYSGQLGNGSDMEYSNKPICISDIKGNTLKGKNIVEVQSDYDMMIAIDKEGKVYTWGDNYSGELGNGTNENSNLPICISAIEGNALNKKNIVEVQIDRNTIIALDSGGKVYTWGYNYYGQLGDGTTTNSNKPICISDIEGNVLNGRNIVEVQNDNSTMIAINSEGKVYTWGKNRYGELGNGTDENSNVPICISDIPGNALNGKNIINVQSYEGTKIALDSEGKVYTWGDNGTGQLGNVTEGFYSNRPICISDIPGNALKGKNIVEVQNNGYTVIALDSEGKVYTWGDNESGELGNGTEEFYSNEPICISDILGNALKGKNIVEVQSNGDTVIALDSEGKVYTWGDNGAGQLGDGTNENSNVPISITDNKDVKLYNKKIKTVKKFRLGSQNHISYITQEGELYNYYFVIIVS